MLASLPESFPPEDANYAVDLVRDAAGLQALRPEWDGLYAVSPTASPPLRWEWVAGWWRVYGPIYGDYGRGLRIVAIRQSGQLVGILPLYQDRCGVPPFRARRLRFVSTGAAEFEETGADYLDLLYAPGAAPGCLRAVRTALHKSSALHWDQLELAELSGESPLLSLVATGGLPLGRVDEYGTCYRSDLTGGFERYLGRLSAGARAEARQLARKAAGAGLTFEVAATPEQADAYFSQMVDLHKRRWQAVHRRGSFAPRHAEFHRSLVAALVSRGAVVLARLSQDNRPFAVTYGHRFGSTYHDIQRGVNLAARAVRSPGTAVLMLLMAHLAERGVTCYDHLTGRSLFKEKYSTDRHNLVRIRATRPTSRSLVSLATDYTGRAARKALALLKRRTAGSADVAPDS
jgi:CelD/BcsL family acetyltransferase involved in cellulose biosynthesis